MLKETYTYTPLSRVNVDGSRHYQTPGGKPLPSVTTVLSALADKTAIHEWRKRVGNEEANRITDCSYCCWFGNGGSYRV